MTNIELKARTRSLRADARTCRRIGARRAACVRQRDTYFRTPAGRLKLRETAAGKAELIVYLRPDTPRARACRYAILPVADPAPLRRLLGACLGTLGEVRKTRRVWLWRGVRIHLDDVRGLGPHIEFEAVLARGKTPRLGRRQLAFLCDAFGIRAADIARGSYLDLGASRTCAARGGLPVEPGGRSLRK